MIAHLVVITLFAFGVVFALRVLSSIIQFFFWLCGFEPTPLSDDHTPSRYKAVTLRQPQPNDRSHSQHNHYHHNRRAQQAHFSVFGYTFQKTKPAKAEYTPPPRPQPPFTEKEVFGETTIRR